MLPVLFYSAILSTYQEACKLELDTILARNFEVLTEKAINISRNNEVKKYQVKTRIKYFDILLNYKTFWSIRI